MLADNVYVKIFEKFWGKKLVKTLSHGGYQNSNLEGREQSRHPLR